jgi:hypothetical protein
LEIEMRNGGGFRVLAAVLLIAFVGFITAGAYWAGYSAGSGPNAIPPAPWTHGGAFGAGHLFGFLIALFVLFIVIRLIFGAFAGPRHHAWGGHGGWSRFGPCEPDEWQRSEWRQAGENTFDEWHRKSHDRGAGSQQGPAQ